MGIKKQNLKVTDEAIRKIIEDYTAESGVRGLKKQMDTLCRSAAVRLVRGDQKQRPGQRETAGGISGPQRDAP